MSRPNPFVLTGIFLFIIGILVGLPWLKGGLYLDSHEADVFHLLDVSFRMVEGQMPHLDFVTPLGILAFLPIVAFMKAGLPFGAAFMAAQLLVALLLLPIVVYAVCTRLTKRQGAVFGAVVFTLVLTMTYLQASSGVTVAMHYNRWCWAVAFVALLIAFCPAKGAERPQLDGVLVGLLTTVLLLTKVTFFIALVPAMAVALFIRKQNVSVVFAVTTGVILIAASSLVWGVGFWTAYAADLLNVSGSEVRPNVGVPFSELLSGPQFIGITIIGAAASMIIRRAGHEALGLAAFGLLLPGFIYVTYQNFGNDPTWLLFMAFLVLAYRPQEGYARVLGVDVRGIMNVLSLVAVLMNLPSLFTTAVSPLDHLAFEKARFMPFLDDPAQDDLFIRRDRANLMTASIALDDNPGVWEKYREDAERTDIPVVDGVRFPMCELGGGSRAFLSEVASQLAEDEIAPGSQFFTTGILSAFWLYGDFAPLKNGAPWYYGKLTGLENADYVLIPKCVYVERIKRMMIAELLDAGTPLTLAKENDLYALFEIR